MLVKALSGEILSTVGDNRYKNPAKNSKGSSKTVVESTINLSKDDPSVHLYSNVYKDQMWNGSKKINLLNS